MPILLISAALKLRTFKDDGGAAAVEFAMILPVMLLAVVGGIVFAFALQQYLAVCNAAGVGVSQLTVGRGSTTPYSSTISAIDASASTLTTSKMTITVSVNGANCSTDSTCETALTAAQSKQASVSISYPCSLTVLQFNFAPSGGCMLSSSIIGLVQ